MAEWRGMKVKLNSPTAIRKGEPGYGRKAKKVFVMCSYDDNRCSWIWWLIDHL